MSGVEVRSHHSLAREGAKHFSRTRVVGSAMTDGGRRGNKKQKKTLAMKGVCRTRLVEGAKLATVGVEDLIVVLRESLRQTIRGDLDGRRRWGGGWTSSESVL